MKNLYAAMSASSGKPTHGRNGSLFTCLLSLLCLILLTSCTFSLEPISAVRSEDNGICGQWKSIDSSEEEVILTISKDSADYKISVEHTSQNNRIDQCRGYVNKLKSGNFINIESSVPVSQIDQSADWYKDKAKNIVSYGAYKCLRTFIFYKYCLSADNLDIWQLDTNALVQDIKTHKLSGTVSKTTQDTTVWITDKSADIQKYLESGAGKNIFKLYGRFKRWTG